jgi:hypothetical protein
MVGAVDAKVTSATDFAAGQFEMIFGPTHEDEPAFDWSAFPDFDEPHLGQPTRFDNFTWTNFVLK